MLRLGRFVAVIVRVFGVICVFVCVYVCGTYVVGHVIIVFEETERCVCQMIKRECF